jgi:hypothetical protein
MTHAATSATTMAMIEPTETSWTSPRERFCATTCGAAVITVTVTGTPAVASIA